MQDRGRRRSPTAGLPRDPPPVRADHGPRREHPADLGIVSRIGAGYDTVDTDACERRAWGRQLARLRRRRGRDACAGAALASIRNIVAYHRDIAAGHVVLHVVGKLVRPSLHLRSASWAWARIGKRMAHISRNVFKARRRLRPISSTATSRLRRGARTTLAAPRRSRTSSLHAATAETRGMIDARFFRSAEAAPPRTPRAARSSTSWTCGGTRRRDAGAGLDVLPPEASAARFAAHRDPARDPHAARGVSPGGSGEELRRKAAQNIITWLDRGALRIRRRPRHAPKPIANDTTPNPFDPARPRADDNMEWRIHGPR